MPILAGFHVEGSDHLILRAFVAKILLLPEDEITMDFIDAPGRGWEFVLQFIPSALHRFYQQCAQFAVVGIDNDGNIDLDQVGGNEDPSHPRHSNHPGTTIAACRRCTVAQVVAEVRPHLNWIRKKPGATWPILIAVPEEMIETWLLILRGEPNIQRRPRSIQKQRLYGKPAATRGDVVSIALPLVRSMTVEGIASLVQTSPSFRDFHDQLSDARPIICGSAGCW
jgi:hypothetical protein